MSTEQHEIPQWNFGLINSILTTTNLKIDAYPEISLFLAPLTIYDHVSAGKIKIFQLCEIETWTEDDK